MRGTRFLVGAAFAAIVLTSCSSGGSVITLRADGSPGRAAVTYQAPDGDVAETVDLPWTTEVAVGGSFSVSLEVTNLGEQGTVSCSLEGEALIRPVQARGEAGAECTAEVSSSGGAREAMTEAIGRPFVRVDGQVTDGVVEVFPVSAQSVRDSVLLGNTLWLAVDATQYVAVDVETGDVLARRYDKANSVAAIGEMLYGLDHFEDRVFSFGVDQPIEDIGSVPGPVWIRPVGGQLWIGLEDDRIARLNPESGEVLGWVADPGFEGLLAVHGDVAIGRHRAFDGVRFFDAASGGFLGEMALGFAPTGGALLRSGNVLLPSQSEEILIEIDPDARAIVAQIRTEGAPSVAAGDDATYVSVEGVIHRYDHERHRLEGAITGVPGRVLGAGGGRLVLGDGESLYRVDTSFLWP